MKATIKHTHTVHMFGRNIICAQLYSDKGEPIHKDDSLATILRYVLEEDLVLTNAQEILDLVVRQQGYAS